jgi:hypothetical protein
MKTKSVEKKEFMNPYDLSAVGRKLQSSMKSEPARPFSRDPYSTAADHYRPTQKGRKDSAQ